MKLLGIPLEVRNNQEFAELYRRFLDAPEPVVPYPGAVTDFEPTKEQLEANNAAYRDSERGRAQRALFARFPNLTRVAIQAQRDLGDRGLRTGRYLVEGDTITAYGDPDHTRSFSYVISVSDGL